MFDDGCCYISDKKYGQKLFSIPMAPNKMFPFDVLNMENCSLVAKVSCDKLWHLRYGHLHEKGLKLLVQKNMVVGLPKVKSLDFCEGCVYGKQSR